MHAATFVREAAAELGHAVAARELEPEWGRFPFVYAVVIVLVVIEVIGVMEAVQRDNKELKQIEALVESKLAESPDAQWFGIHFGPTEFTTTPDRETVQWIEWAGCRPPHPPAHSRLDKTPHP